MKNTGRSNAKARILCAASALALLLLAAAAFSACRAESRTADADAEHEGRTLDLRAEALPEIEWLLEQATRYDCIDLRGHDEITSGEIARLRQENPACEILWSVPLGSGRYDTTLTHITCSDITAEEIALLDAFPKLALLDGRGSACYRELCAYQAAHPDCEVLWTVPIAGVEADSDIEWLSLGGQTPERHGELLELLAYLPKLTDVDLVGTMLSTSEKAALRQKYPEIRFYWTIDFPERQFRSTDERLDFTTVYFRDIEELAETVRCFQHPTWVDVSTLGFENVEMEALLAEFPDTKFVWIVRVGKYTLRTDVTIFNGESHSGDRLLRDADIVPLKYCTELEAVGYHAALHPAQPDVSRSVQQCDTGRRSACGASQPDRSEPHGQRDRKRNGACSNAAARAAMGLEKPACEGRRCAGTPACSAAGDCGRVQRDQTAENGED